MTQVTRALQGSVPKGCMVTSYELKGKTVNVNFTAQNSYIASEFLSNIQMSSFFKLSNDMKNLNLPDTNTPLEMNISLQIGKG
jgi:Tfp pilus assembly protein PilN